MATQSLYRRYRPRRFEELKGQDHVVRALRDSVRSGRSGQAYLFSGPRGTGKTSSARILAKVLNCQEPVDGEPCCVCDSCVAVERGTSYDVHELDAASNNGVDAIRDLLEKASLGTPGRHKVYILDEVHMLSKGAEAALLKTLEEPPPHVVFVLATTDPQKMSDTIRSRTQHLQFHLLPPDTLADHVRWVAADAGLDLSDEAFEVVVNQGGGSARDTLSALELMAATGGDVSDQVDLELFVRAFVDRDAAQALTVVAQAVRTGHEPRRLTEDLIAHLRNGFLSLMAPDLVMLPRQRVDQIATTAQQLGAAALVRSIERLGTSLIEMRHAPDPRVLLEVALVQLTNDDAGGTDLVTLSARLDRLEQAVRAGAGTVPTGAAGGAAGAGAGAGAGAPGAGGANTSPVDPATGRAVLGGRARRNPGSVASASAVSAPETPASEPAQPVESARPAPAADVGGAASAQLATESAPASQPVSAVGTSPAPAVAAVSVTDAWETTVRPNLKPFVRALYSAGAFTRHDGEAWYFAVPNAAHGDKCEGHRKEVEAALSAAVGAPVKIVISVGGQPTNHDDPAPANRSSPTSGASDTNVGSGSNGAGDNESSGAAAGSTKAPLTPATEADEAEIDLDDLIDAPPESVLSPVDRLAQAFPGAELIDDD
jgi:DNA polymerase-3 subunit gamma/tau